MFFLIRVWSDSTEVGDRMAAGDQAHVAESDDDDDGDGGDGDHHHHHIAPPPPSHLPPLWVRRVG